MTTRTHDLAPDRIEVHHLLDMHVEFEPVPTIATPRGTRMVFAARTGRFAGPGIAGTVLPGSADWLTVGDDAIGRVDVRAALRTEDGEHIAMTVTGRVVLGEHATRLFAGEQVTAEQAYIRTHPLFDTSAPRYAHLNGLATVAFCDIALTDIHYRVYRIG
jgi:hypothetical protein